jgi:hypothetical protein
MSRAYVVSCAHVAHALLRALIVAGRQRSIRETESRAYFLGRSLVDNVIAHHDPSVKELK